MDVPAHLVIKTDGFDFASLLEEWRWLLKEEYSPLLMNSFGDLFLCDQKAQVHFLDLMSGKLEVIAPNTAEFQVLCGDREMRRQFFIPHLVMELRKACGELSMGECYGCKVPLTLGGKLEALNFERTDLSVHYSVFGQLYQQISQLAPGKKISSIHISRNR